MVADLAWRALGALGRALLVGALAAHLVRWLWRSRSHG
jgi:hypothetical protein